MGAEKFPDLFQIHSIEEFLTDTYVSYWVMIEADRPVGVAKASGEGGY